MRLIKVVVAFGYGWRFFYIPAAVQFPVEFTSDVPAASAANKQSSGLFPARDGVILIV